MSISSYFGTLSAPASTGNQGYTGVGFQPKALIIWGGSVTADGFATDIVLGFGFATGASAQRAVGTSGADNVSTSDHSRGISETHCIAIPNNAASAYQLQADLVSFDADGFTLSWDVTISGAKFNYIALGGNDLSNAEVGTITSPAATGNANQSTGFQGNLLLLAGSFSSVAYGTNLSFTLGAAKSNTEQWATTFGGADGATKASNLNAERQQRTDRCLVQMGGSTGAVLGSASFVSFNATPSFTLNWSIVPTPSFKFPYLLLNINDSFAVGAFAKSTNTSVPVTQNITAPGFRPGAVLLSSFNAPAATTDQNNADVSIGGGDGTREGCHWTQLSDTAFPTEANQNHDGAKAFGSYSGASTVVAEADLATTSNGFDLTWTTNDSNANQICYICFGTAISATNVSPTGLASTVAIGTPTVTPGSVTATATGIASTAAVGTPTVTSTITASPTGIASTAAVGSPTVISFPMTDLLAHWRLDESSGMRYATYGGNHLTDVNTVTQLAGKIGNAAQFDAANRERLTHVDNAALSVGDENITFAAWVYFDVVNEDSYIISKATADTNEYLLMLSGATSQIVWYVENGASYSMLTWPDALSAGQWYFIVAWHDATNNQTGLVVNNGTPQTEAYSAGVLDGVGTFMIGGISYTDPMPAITMHGRIDSVSMWQRVLPVADRTSLYNFGNGLDIPYAAVSPLEPTGLASTVAIGTPTVTFVVTVSPTGLASTEAIGTPTVTTGAVTATAVGIASTEAIGTPTVTISAIVSPSGIASTVAIGTATITVGSITATATGIASTEAIGTPVVTSTSTISLVFIEPGSDATYNGVLYNASSVGAGASLGSSSAQTHTGPRSIRAESGTSNGQAYYDRDIGTTNAALASGRMTSWWYPTHLPSSDHVGIFRTGPQAGAFYVSLGTDGKLRVQTQPLAASGTVFATGTAVIGTGSWQRISVAWTVTNSTTWTVKVWVNGILDINTSNGSSLPAGPTTNDVRFGWIGAPGASKEIFWDDVVVDDKNTLDDIGDLRVTAKLPTTVNNNNFDTTVGTGAVNERPTNDGNGKQHADSTDVTQDYNIQAANVGDVDISSAPIVGYMGWIRAKRGTGTAGTPKLILNGSDYDLAPTISTISQSHIKCITSPTYPSNAATIGMRSTATDADTFLYECGIVFAYRPTLTVSPTGLSSTAAIGTPTVTPGSVTATATGIASTVAIGTPVVTISGGATNVEPTGLASTAVVGTPTVTPGSVTVSPTGLASTVAIGTVTVTTLATVSPTGIASTAAIGTPTVTAGSVTASPTGIASATAIGTPTVSPGSVTASPSGIASTVGVGTPTVNIEGGPTTVSPNGLASTVALGTPTVTPGSVTASPSGIASTAAIGTPTANQITTVSPSGLSSTVAVGTPTVTPGSVTVSPASIASTTVFGTPIVNPITNVSVNGIASTAVVGTPVITVGAVTVIPTGIGSTVVIGVPNVLGSTVFVEPIGIGSTVQIGQVVISWNGCAVADIQLVTRAEATIAFVRAEASIELVRGEGTITLVDRATSTIELGARAEGAIELCP